MTAISHVAVHPDYHATWLEAVFLTSLDGLGSLSTVSFPGLHMYDVLCLILVRCICPGYMINASMHALDSAPRGEMGRRVVGHAL